MRSDFLDRYSRLDSTIHRLPAALKLAVALALVVVVVSLPGSAWPWFIVVGGLLIVVAAISHVPPMFLLRRLLLLEPFVLGVAMLALFQPGGVRLFVLLLARSTVCLATMILLSNTTPFSQILRVLKAVRVPSLLITTLALMYRYLFVLVDEAERMKRARMSRTFGSRRRGAWRGLSTVLSQLFIRASERAERIYSAMCARGWR